MTWVRQAITGTFGLFLLGPYNLLKGPMSRRPQRRPWSAIVLALWGATLIVYATIRLRDLPFAGRGSTRIHRLWQKDPSSVVTCYAGLICLVLAAWLARLQQDLEDANDPTDDPILRLNESDPITHPPDSNKPNDPSPH
jgi:cobalamin synthase